MRCDNCQFWTVATATLYEDGSRVEQYRAPDRHGRCEHLSIETLEDFGCTKFEEGYDHEHLMRKPGAPWHYSKAGPCPDCSAAGNQGDGSCRRCAGTGKVRHYEDGYIGEEQTRLHPKEREAAVRPTCAGCGRGVDRDWMTCPYCSHKLDAAVQTEIVKDALGAVS